MTFEAGRWRTIPNVPVGVFVVVRYIRVCHLVIFMDIDVVHSLRSVCIAHVHRCTKSTLSRYGKRRVHIISSIWSYLDRQHPVLELP